MSEMVHVKTDETLCKSHKKIALSLGSLSEEVADEGSKARKRCTKDTGSRTKTEGNYVNRLSVSPSASDSGLVT